MLIKSSQNNLISIYKQANNSIINKWNNKLQEVVWCMCRYVHLHSQLNQVRRNGLRSTCRQTRFHGQLQVVSDKAAKEKKLIIIMKSEKAKKNTKPSW